MKKIAIDLNIKELRLIDLALSKLHLGDLSQDNQTLYNRLSDVLAEQIANLEEDEENCNKTFIDSDGNEVLTDQAYESGMEYAASLRSGD